MNLSDFIESEIDKLQREYFIAQTGVERGHINGKIYAYREVFRRIREESKS